MESARRIIAALLALACIAQPLMPCRCRVAASACSAECCVAKAKSGQQADECQCHCSHSHGGNRQSFEVESRSSAPQEQVPTPAPSREKCPYCHCQSWLALPNSYSRDIHDHSCCDTVLNVRVQIVQFDAYIQPVGGLNTRATVLSPVRLLCRIQV